MKGGIPTQDTQRCVVKLERLYDELRNIRKSSYRPTEAQRKSQDARKDKFIESLDDLFDVAHANALDMIKIEEDRQFLEQQRKKGRPGGFSGIDRKLAEKQKRSAQRRERVEQREQRAQAEKEADQRPVQSSDISFADMSESHSPPLPSRPSDAGQ